MPTYSPLPDGSPHIRLLLLQKNPREAALQGSLMTCPLSEVPCYEALSYVWGKPKPKFPVTCDGEISQISQNLHDALSRIMASTPEGDLRTLWVDQICINQDDQMEKNVQLPLMGDIYTKAENVLVWLGNPSPGIKDVGGCVELLPSLIKTVDTALSQRSGPWLTVKQNAHLGFPPDHHEVWQVAKDILYAEWFQRLWTLQEAVLAKNMVVFYGSTMFDWDLLIQLHKAACTMRLPLKENLAQQSQSHHQYIRWINTYRTRKERGLSNPLYYLLSVSGSKNCSQPVDRVYGLLGMVDDTCRNLIKVDYDKIVHQVYLEASKAAISFDTELYFLTLCFEQGDIRHFPTWCPDLTRWNGCEQLPGKFSYAGTRASETIEASVEILSPSHHLKIQGVEVDRISSIVQSNYPGPEITDLKVRHLQLSAFRDETLHLAQSVYRTGNSIPEQHWRILSGDVCGRGDGLATSGGIIGYKSFFNVDFRQRNPWAHLPQQEKNHGSQYNNAVLRMCYRRKYIATTNGRGGLAPAKCRVGDIICVFRGRLPFVLRPNDDNGDPKTFSFIGDCYVHGLLESEALDMVDAGKLQFTDFIVT
jgi:hypothetical protein